MQVTYRRFAVIALFGTMVGSSGLTAAYADPVPGDSIVLRQGNANEDDNYSGEDQDIKERLQQVSALCSKKAIEKTRDATKALVKTDKTRNWKEDTTGVWGIAKASTITGLGGKVETDPQNKNPNHCLISGLKIGQLKGAWVLSEP